MINMSFYRFIFSFLFFFPVTVSFAQKGAMIRASVDKKKILLGEPLQLTLEIYFPPKTPAKGVTFDTIGHFEFLEKPLVDSVHNPNGTTIKKIFTLTSFDSGHWVIPALSLSRSVKTDTLPVDVVFSEFDPAQDYHDIKDIIEVEVKQKPKWWPYAAAGGLLLVLLVLYFLLRRRPEKSKKILPQTDPYEEALQRLEQLRKTKLDPKEFHSALSDIFRLYVFRRKGIFSLQKTTDDLVLQLQGQAGDREQFEKLSQSLRLGDFVKFAKYVPAEQDDRMAWEEIRKTIMAMEKSETPNLPEGGRKK